MCAGLENTCVCCAAPWAHLSSAVLQVLSVLLASGYQQISLFEGEVAAVQLASCAEVL